MKLTFYSFLIILFITSSCEQVKVSTVHRRNFSKNVFEEEFAAAQVGCDTINNSVLVPDTKWLDIADKHLSDQNQRLHKMELNKILSVKERTFQHELILEKIENGAFLFRYTGIQTTTDTIRAMSMNKLGSLNLSKVDSSRIFSFEGESYYRVNKAKAKLADVETIYKKMRVEDKGRVVCKCDYYVENS